MTHESFDDGVPRHNHILPLFAVIQPYNITSSANVPQPRSKTVINNIF